MCEYNHDYPIWCYQEHSKSHDKAKFCPHCGEPLTEPKPLTLEELRERDGKTVYIPESDEYKGGHGIVDIENDRVYSTDVEAGYWPLMEYGDFWLAYDRPPKEG